MVTFVIPTLWKSEYIYKTIDAIQASSIPGIELIIFDNAQKGYSNEDPRIKIINDKNYWVNPAWNKGVELANNDWVCLLNDDVHVNIDLLCKEFNRLIIQSDHKDNFGTLAFHSGSWFSEEINKDTDTLELAVQTHRGTGFGQMIILKKENYVNIPDHFKIYFGDDLIHYLQEGVLRNKSWYFKGLKTIGELSKTSASVEDQIQKEFVFWKQTTDEWYNKYAKK
jgi:glycosyltransferase involved in cell wall biosynthesis